MVCKELSREGAPDIVRAWNSRPPAWLEIATPVGLPGIALMHVRIHAGEREAMLLAEDLKADALIMDDLTGRREAERRHLRVTGTVGGLRAATRIA